MCTAPHLLLPKSWRDGWCTAGSLNYQCRWYFVMTEEWRSYKVTKRDFYSIKLSWHKSWQILDKNNCLSLKVSPFSDVSLFEARYFFSPFHSKVPIACDSINTVESRHIKYSFLHSVAKYWIACSSINTVESKHMKLPTILLASPGEASTFTRAHFLALFLANLGEKISEKWEKAKNKWKLACFACLFWTPFSDALPFFYITWSVWIIGFCGYYEPLQSILVNSNMIASWMHIYL